MLCGSKSYRQVNTVCVAWAVTNQYYAVAAHEHRAGGLGGVCSETLSPFGRSFHVVRLSGRLRGQAWLTRRSEQARKCLVNRRARGCEPAAAVPREAGRVLTFPASTHTRLQSLELRDHLLFVSFRL